MYAKIASTQYEDVDKFVAIAIKEMKDRHGLPKQKIESGKTGDGKPYFINEYPATFTMGARRVYPIASRGCLHRLIVAR